ncbi:glutamine--fructose-6-phosphate transaminase (isomerizing) [Chitinivibrio alkaliphilus]|uniref:Glutamine--fructose-6-phosphate aminotransferase [isomerizing] n=1 Tax=Chitinivibrio alkaliphilus ACht1 TaxID=1313304 RepID=U7DAN7_9BACT|nr:glutamine--fructose-6-phosphate transaminase (isomerizing) [Chitinivibrio alkaliphilus]ERP32192.1 glucosamine-fructose-6-phosphate aminotransferase [Chitinivibrio alkaliphilus ACht1]
MCGIVGYVGEGEKKEILLSGLRELEYRGYDSAGIALMDQAGIHHFKAAGKLSYLEAKTAEFTSASFGIGIGHTRWATHGKPNEINAHPHLGKYSFVVHNGIIENYQELKGRLQKKGVSFLSQTDTEVIVHLFEYYNEIHTDPFCAFEKTIGDLQGAYAILLITKASPNHIFFAKEGSPLILGTDAQNHVYIGSSDAALIGKAHTVTYLEDGQYGRVYKGALEIFVQGKQILPPMVPLQRNTLYAQKEGYRFFMEKEIYEQSSVLSNAMLGRLREKDIFFEEITPSFLSHISHITFCACGTSYHAALSAAYLFERLAQVSTSVEIASEFRYKKPYIQEGTLFIVISQSGETADTLEALKRAKRSTAKTLAICNVDNSSIVRTADTTLLTRAGIEKGVASTKAFATQMLVLWMLALEMGKETMTSTEYAENIRALRKIPTATQVSTETHERIQRLSKRYLHGHGFFFIGRDIFYPLALEGALKLKEISYLHAEGYPSGEMKHGPIALVDSELFTICLMPKTTLYEKNRSNVEELSARDATICAITPEPFSLADDLIYTKHTEHPMCEFFEMMVVLQLLSLEIAIRLGNDVDMPRNLAKSVTVE